MHHAVQAGLELHKRAIGHDADHLAGHDVARLILLAGDVPGLGLSGLVAQGDTAALGIQLDDLHVDLLTHADDLRGMTHAMPGQIGHVNQAVHAADVHESAEVGQAANNALDHVALMQLFPGLGLLGLFLDLQNRLTGRDDALLGLVDLDDLQVHFLAHELVDLLDVAQGQQGSGNKRTNAHHVGQQTALDSLLAHALDGLLVVVSGHDRIPNLTVHDIALGEQHIALAVVNLHNFHFDLVVDLDIRRGEVALLDQTVGLIAHVDAHFVVGNLHNLAGHGLAGTQLYQGLLEIFHEIGIAGLLKFNLFLFFDVAHSCNNLLKCTVGR